MNKLIKRITAVILSAAEVITVCAFGPVAFAAKQQMAVSTIAAGEHHTLVVKSDMTLWAAGDNSMGQLGVEDIDESNGVKVMNNIVYVEANDDVSFAIDANGVLYGWGDNSDGQISAASSQYTITKPMKLMENVIEVSAGDEHTIVLTADGTAYGWGSNAFGELGMEPNTRRNSVTEIKKNIVDIAAGDGFSMFVTGDGALYGCGKNDDGQLGYGNYRDQSTPVVSIASGVASVEAGNTHTVILKTDGSVWTAGSNSDGQLGDDTDRRVSQTFISTGLTKVSAVFAGGFSTGAVTDTGSIYTWGENTSGQLHNGKTTSLYAPALVTTGAASIAFGEHHSVMLKTNGSVSTAGDGASGELFSGKASTTVLKPSKVYSNVLDYSAGYDHAALVTTSYTLYTWGNNDCGQLGVGDTSARTAPTKVKLPNDDRALRVWCGPKTTFVLGDNGVYVFGNNKDCVLGLETSSTIITTPKKNNNFYNKRNIEIYPGNGYGLAIIEGTVYGWGKNTAGRMLDLPSKVIEPMVLSRDLNSVDKLAVADNHVLALIGNEVYGWGSNSSYQLGVSGISIVDEPIRVSLENSRGEVEASTFNDIAACENYSVLVDDEGIAWTIGLNSGGQLGTDTYRIKTPYSAARGIDFAEAGNNVVALIYKTGKLSLCGRNTNGALGDGTTESRYSFGKETASDPVKVSLGNEFGGYINGSAVLYCWGDNSYGQVGNGSGGVSVAPQAVIDNGLCAAVQKAEGITLDKTSVELKPNGTIKLTATITPANAVGTVITWSSSNESVAKVTKDGIVTAVAKGKAVITAKTMNGLSASCDVTVDVPVTSFSVSPSKSKTLKIGGTFKFTEKVYPSNASDKTLLYSSSDEAVAVVDATGKVKAVSAGKAVITITAKSNPAKTKSVIVKVRPGKVTVTSKKATSNGVSLKWNEVKGVEGYDVFRKVSGSSASAKAIADVKDATSFVDSTAVKGKTYVYSVRAYVIIDGVKLYSSAYTQYKITAK